jgi:hypothetical protein
MALTIKDFNESFHFTIGNEKHVYSFQSDNLKTCTGYIKNDDSETFAQAFLITKDGEIYAQHLNSNTRFKGKLPIAMYNKVELYKKEKSITQEDFKESFSFIEKKTGQEYRFVYECKDLGIGTIYASVRNGIGYGLSCYIKPSIDLTQMTIVKKAMGKIMTANINLNDYEKI